MKRFILLLIIFICSPSFSSLWGADWKLVGGSSSKGIDVLSFYDDESVDRRSNMNIKVWTKNVKKSDLERVNNKQEEKKIIDAAAKKLISGYEPPYSAVQKDTTSDDTIGIILWEEAIKLHEVKVLSTILWELDCKEKRIRTLSVTVYNKDKTIRSPSIPSDWNYAAPESTGETLFKILCK